MLPEYRHNVKKQKIQRAGRKGVRGQGMAQKGEALVVMPGLRRVRDVGS